MHVPAGKNMATQQRDHATRQGKERQKLRGYVKGGTALVSEGKGSGALQIGLLTPL